MASNTTSLYISDNGIQLMVTRGKRITKLADVPLDTNLSDISSGEKEEELVNKIISPDFHQKKFGPPILNFINKVSSRIKRLRISNLSIVSWLSGILSLVFGVAGIFSGAVLALNTYIDIEKLSAVSVLFAKTASPAVSLALAAVVIGTIDLIKDKDDTVIEERSWRSIAGIIFGVATLVFITIIFFLFPYFILSIAKIIPASTGSY